MHIAGGKFDDSSAMEVAVHCNIFNLSALDGSIAVCSAFWMCTVSVQCPLEDLHNTDKVVSTTTTIALSSHVQRSPELKDLRSRKNRK